MSMPIMDHKSESSNLKIRFFKKYGLYGGHRPLILGPIFHSFPPTTSLFDVVTFFCKNVQTPVDEDNFDLQSMIKIFTLAGMLALIVQENQ